MPFQSIQLTYLFLMELQGAKHVVKVVIAVVNFRTFPSGLCSLFCGEGLRIVGSTGSSLCRELLFGASASATCSMLWKHLLPLGISSLFCIF